MRKPSDRMYDNFAKTWRSLFGRRGKAILLLVAVLPIPPAGVGLSIEARGAEEASRSPSKDDVSSPTTRQFNKVTGAAHSIPSIDSYADSWDPWKKVDEIPSEFVGPYSDYCEAGWYHYGENERTLMRDLKKEQVHKYAEVRKSGHKFHITWTDGSSQIVLISPKYLVRFVAAFEMDGNPVNGFAGRIYPWCGPHSIKR